MSTAENAEVTLALLFAVRYRVRTAIVFVNH
uniref:Uncharacterized protein n=1 Tax=Rhizophora mucronata TaxID=61149 RepID=A0A2P2QZI9_RHIMU